MPTYTLASRPRPFRLCASASACSSVILRRGDPPPMALYPSLDLGARSVEMSFASGRCRKRAAQKHALSKHVHQNMLQQPA